MKGFAKRLKKHRELEKLTQGELAKKVGTTVATISRLESGKITNPRADLLFNLSLELHVSMEELWDDKFELTYAGLFKDKPDEIKLRMLQMLYPIHRHLVLQLIDQFLHKSYTYKKLIRYDQGQFIDHLYGEP